MSQEKKSRYPEKKKQIDLKFESYNFSNLTKEDEDLIDVLGKENIVNARMGFIEHADTAKKRARKDQTSSSYSQTDADEILPEEQTNIENKVSLLKNTGLHKDNTYVLSNDLTMRTKQTAEGIIKGLDINQNRSQNNVNALDTSDKNNPNLTNREAERFHIGSDFAVELLENLKGKKNINIVSIMHSTTIPGVFETLLRKNKEEIRMIFSGIRSLDIYNIDVSASGEAIDYEKKKELLFLNIHNIGGIIDTLGDDKLLKPYIALFGEEKLEKLQIFELQNIINAYFKSNPKLYEQYLNSSNFDIAIFCLVNLLKNEEYGVVDLYMYKLMLTHKAKLQEIASCFLGSDSDKEAYEVFIKALFRLEREKKFIISDVLMGYVTEQTKKLGTPYTLLMNHYENIEPLIEETRRKSLDVRIRMGQNIQPHFNLDNKKYQKDIINIATQQDRITNKKHISIEDEPHLMDREGGRITYINASAGSGKSFLLSQINAQIKKKTEINMFPIYINLSGMDLQGMKQKIAVIHEKYPIRDFNPVYIIDSLDESDIKEEGRYDFYRYLWELSGRVIVAGRPGYGPALTTNDLDTIEKSNSYIQSSTDDLFSTEIGKSVKKIIKDALAVLKARPSMDVDDGRGVDEWIGIIKKRPDHEYIFAVERLESFVLSKKRATNEEIKSFLQKICSNTKVSKTEATLCLRYLYNTYNAPEISSQTTAYLLYELEGSEGIDGIPQSIIDNLRKYCEESIESERKEKKINFFRENVEEVKILEFTKDQINDFVEKYFEGNRDKMSKFNIFRNEKKWLKRIEGNPLILSMVCDTINGNAIDADDLMLEDISKIDSMYQLYENIVKLRLYRRNKNVSDREKDIEGSRDSENEKRENVTENIKNITAFLMDISYENIVYSKNIDKDLIGAYKRKNNIGGLNLETINLIFRKDSVSKQYIFVHESFKEYFAALKMMQSLEVGELKIDKLISILKKGSFQTFDFVCDLLGKNKIYEEKIVALLKKKLSDSDGYIEPASDSEKRSEMSFSDQRKVRNIIIELIILYRRNHEFFNEYLVYALNQLSSIDGVNSIMRVFYDNGYIIKERDLQIVYKRMHALRGYSAETDATRADICNIMLMPLSSGDDMYQFCRSKYSEMKDMEVRWKLLNRLRRSKEESKRQKECRALYNEIISLSDEGDFYTCLAPDYRKAENKMLMEIRMELKIIDDKKSK